MISRVSIPLVGFLFLCIWKSIMVEGEDIIYMDPKQPINARVEDLLDRMTLGEKIGQMMQIEWKNVTTEIMREYGIGSLLSEAGSAPSHNATAEVWVQMINGFQKGSLSSRLGIPMIYGIDAVHGHNTVYKATIFPHNVGLGVTRTLYPAGATKNVTSEIMREYGIGSLLSEAGSAPSHNATAEVWVEMINGFQKGSLSSRLGIPMIHGIDAVHGHNTVYKATIFPHNVGLGVTRDPELVKRIGAATALEVRATGIQYAFAPCIAVCRDPRWGRCYESYSEDPKIVQQMTEVVSGLQGDIPPNGENGSPYIGGRTKIVACAKHYVGDGGTIKGTDENNTVIDWDGLLKIHMPAYPDSIAKGVATVMVSYSSWNGRKMHDNYDLVTEYLKGILGFKGFVISDWKGIDRMTSPPHANYTHSVQAAIHAGIDMVMVPYNFTEFIDVLTSLVKMNVIPMSRIDDAVSRILRVKFVAGLFENPLADLSLANQIGSKAHRDLAREAVRKSLVLLKNGKNTNKPLLPLPKNTSKILVAGSHANDLGLQCGGWTITWQGQRGNNITTGTTILRGIKSTVDPTTKVVYKKHPNVNFVKDKNFDYAIVVVGEPPYAEYYGDNLNLTIPAPGRSTIRNVCASVECVVVLISGRPLVIRPYLAAIDALVAAWLPGSEGRGVADVLFGDYGFSGKLARTWFKTVDQLPMNVGDGHYDPLFPFGFGLETKPVVGRY